MTAGPYPGVFSPVPVVTVDGADVASGAAGSGLMVVDDVRVTWGRDDVLDGPTPANGRLVVFDPSRTWATDSDRRGRPVTIRYAGTHPTTGAAASGIYFRGRIGSPVKVSPRTVRHPTTGRTIRGALVELPLQSLEVDLANVVPRSSWPVETLGARVDRVVTVARQSALLAGGANVRDYWKPPNVAPVDKKDQVSLLDHVSALFRSAGADNWTYRPDTDQIVYTPRRNYEAAVTMGRLVRSTTGARGGKGAYVSSRDRTFAATDTEPAAGLFLDSRSLEYDPADGVVTPARVTRVALTHPSDLDGYAARTVELPVRREAWDPLGGNAPLEETILGVRTARVDSVVAFENFADLGASDTEVLVRREGSRWLLDPLRLTTRKVGGFESFEVAQVLLSGYERNATLFLQRSFLPMLGLRPVVGVMGATITYARGGWDVEFQPAPITTTVPQHSLTWEELNTTDPALRLKWWDGSHPEGLDPTVTYEDLRFVGVGLDAVVPGPYERDEYQA